MLVNPDTCIGCKLCSWACPYGAREYDYDDGVMKKCTLCVDRIYNENLARGGSQSRPACAPARPAPAISATWATPSSAVSQLVAERGGYDLLPEMGYKPVNKYLPPRPRRDATLKRRRIRAACGSPAPRPAASERLFAWVDRMLSPTLPLPLGGGRNATDLARHGTRQLRLQPAN